MNSHASQSNETPDARVNVMLKTCGFLTPMCGFFVSLSDAEQWLRVTSLIIGIGVGIVSFMSILRKMPPGKP